MEQKRILLDRAISYVIYIGERWAMDVQIDILSLQTREKVTEEVAKFLGVDPSEIAIKSFSYEMSSETLNLRDVTRKAIIKAMARSGGKISAAAKVLGVTRKTLYAMIKKYELGSILHIHD